MTTTSTIESVAGAAQFIGTQIAKYYGGPIGQAAASLLLGEVSWTASTTDLIVKIRSGDATVEDVADVLNRTAQVLAGFGVLAGCVNPIFLPITGAVAGALFVHKNWGKIPGFDPALYPDPLIPEETWSKLTNNTAINTNFLAAPKAAPLRRDPLILDLDNDGLETVGIDTARPILFDHTGTGLKTASGWVKPDDAFLVIDRNGNGRIDSGRELFGDATPLAAGGSATDGFAALAQEDSNHDGQVTAADARWADLHLWRDLNQDGLTQSGELSTLSDHGITALNVAKTSHSTLLDNGNQIADLGGFLRADGRLGTLGEVEQLEQLADINLISNPFYSEFTDAIPLTETAQHLPDMQGSGKVRDLRQSSYAA